MGNIFVEIEDQYQFLQNSDGEILVAITEKDGEPEEPLLEYAGGEHALLYRRDDAIVILSFVHPGIRGALHQADRVTVAEIGDGEPKREYTVPVKQADKLSVPDEILPKLEG